MRASDIRAGGIRARDIRARDIRAGGIRARGIRAEGIRTKGIRARGISTIRGIRDTPDTALIPLMVWDCRVWDPVVPHHPIRGQQDRSRETLRGE